jgi:hypothetical protein
MHNQDITLFISRDRAARIAEQSITSRQDFDVQPGKVQWGDMSASHGFRVKITERGRFVRFL